MTEAGYEIVRKVKILHVLLGSASVVVVSYLWKGAALSVFLGWVLMACNFELLEWQMKRIFCRGQKPRNRFAVMVKYYLRFVVLALIMWLVIAEKLVKPLPFAAGLFLLGISFVVVAFEMFIKQALGREV
ncbi:ATP synthase subunit I [Thermodesulforhabdus norvegica]|uniref:ATP synthase I chain n=1 Tax=Thermodesulforhabdus norvegica TaxID=39841 RepID=A0A1I4TFM9_9BACT|nr:ATP synthase subunit I [Thermodesulforhabdus norvegica]SFM75489.1 hypothetical protein SAMN05660836_01389 [Thermodesulforhabdus norvegica]